MSSGSVGGSSSGGIKYEKLQPMGIESGVSSESKTNEFSPVTRSGRCCDGPRGAIERYPKTVGGALIAFIFVVSLELILPRLGISPTTLSSSSSTSGSGQVANIECLNAAEKSVPRTFATFAAVGIVAKMDSLRRVQGEVIKHVSDEPLMSKSWEPRIDNGYPNVIKEDDKWKLWYGTCAGLESRVCQRQVVNYAESDDGYTWVKPDLGIFGLPASVHDLGEDEGVFDHSNSSNIWMLGGGVGVTLHDSSLIAFGDMCLPRRAGKKKPNRKRKSSCRDGYKEANVVVAEDGVSAQRNVSFVIDWGEDQRFDCHNNMYFDEARHLYVMTTRTTSKDEGRQIGIAIAPTLKALKKNNKINIPVITTLSGSTEEQFYSQITFPWHNVLLGIVMVYHPATGKVRCRLAFAPQEPQHCWETVFPSAATSGDAKVGLNGTELESWEGGANSSNREDDSDYDFIPLGEEGDFDSHVIFASKPVYSEIDDMLRIYYMGGDAPHGSPSRNTALGLATMLPDKFVGLRPDEFEGTLTTRPIYCPAAAETPRLVVTVDLADESDCLMVVAMKKAGVDEEGDDGENVQVFDENDESARICGGDTDDGTRATFSEIDLSGFADEYLTIEFKLSGPTATLYTLTFS